MLSAHGIYYTDECFVACEEAVTSCQQISFQPSLTHMLAEHGVHNTSVSCKEFVCIIFVTVPVTVCNFEYFSETVGHCLIRSEDTEVSFFLVQFEDISYESAKLDHILSLNSARSRYVNRVITEVRKSQVTKQLTAVCMRVGTDSSVALRSQLFEFRNQSSVLIKQLFRMIALKPVFQDLKVFRLVHHDRHLMCTEGIFNLSSVNYPRACPSLRCTKNDHRPLRSCCVVVLSCVLLDRLDVVHSFVKSLCHLSVHSHVIASVVLYLYEIRFPSASVEEVLQFLMRNTSQYSRIADLVSVHVENRKNSSVCLRVQEFVALP